MKNKYIPIKKFAKINNLKVSRVRRLIFGYTDEKGVEKGIFRQIFYHPVLRPSDYRIKNGRYEIKDRFYFSNEFEFHDKTISYVFDENKFTAPNGKYEGKSYMNFKFKLFFYYLIKLLAEIPFVKKNDKEHLLKTQNIFKIVNKTWSDIKRNKSCISDTEFKEINFQVTFFLNNLKKIIKNSQMEYIDVNPSHVVKELQNKFRGAKGRALSSYRHYPEKFSIPFVREILASKEFKSIIKMNKK